MSSNVFTVFNHGTDFHRDKDPNELITRLSSAMVGDEARIIQTGTRSDECPMPFALETASPHYVICEGPGSEAVRAEASTDGVAHAHPGRCNPIFNVRKALRKSATLNAALRPTGTKRYWLIGTKRTSEFQDHFMGNTDRPSGLSGRILGNGWEDNVYKVVWLLTHLKWSRGQAIDTVNMIGWSRGAVTCLKMANKLFEVFEDTMHVNVFAVDPVPGGLTPETDETKYVPPNVRNYLAILAMDDDRSNFQPLDKTQVKLLRPKSQHGRNGNPDSLNPRLLKPNVHFLPLPGNHSDLVNSELSSAQVQNSSAICRHLAWQFLAAHGTQFNQTFAMNTEELCERYHALRSNHQSIRRAASSGLFGLVGGIKKERQVRIQRTTYVVDSNAYINEHHRLCALKDEYSLCGDGTESFSPKDWSDWKDHKTLDLPECQSSLQAMGIRLGTTLHGG